MCAMRPDDQTYQQQTKASRCAITGYYTFVGLFWTSILMLKYSLNLFFEYLHYSKLREVFKSNLSK